MRTRKRRSRWTDYRMERLVSVTADVARAEGRLQAALGMGSEEFQAFAYGDESLASQDRLDRLQELAGRLGVWIW